MLNLRDQAHRAAVDLKTYVLGPIWGWIYASHLSGALYASPFLWIGVFWLGNIILASGMAIADHTFHVREWKRSIYKLIVWIVGLGVAEGLIRSHIPGGFLPAGIIQFGILFTEGAYVLRNLGRIAKRLGNQNQGDVLEMLAEYSQDYMDQRIHKQTKVVVTETTTTEPIHDHKPSNGKAP